MGRVPGVRVVVWWWLAACCKFVDFMRQSVPTYWSTAVNIATLTLRITADVAKPSEGEARRELGGL